MTTTYRRIIEKAHAKKMQVLVTVPAKYCGDDTDQAAIDAFTAAYVSHLNDLAINVFTGTGKPDAYEIGSDPNVTENTCPDGVSRYRVGPNAFAWLQRRVWDWKQTNARTEMLVSGGIKNALFTINPPPRPPPRRTRSGTACFTSAAFILGTGKIRPFDYLGVHPSNDSKMDYNCINSGYTTCFTLWKNSVKTGIAGRDPRMNLATGTSDTKSVRHRASASRSPRRTSASASRTCTLTNSLPNGSASVSAAGGGHERRGRCVRGQRRDARGHLVRLPG